MVEPRYRWTFADAETVSPAVAAAARGLGLSDRMTGLLVNRGASSGDDIVAWFADPLDGLHDPRRLPDADVLLRRLHLARERAERVLVFGDFDADGLTGLAIMTIALRRFGVAVEPYVPSRLDEGHGLSLAAIDAAVAAGASVIITVDCGTTSVAEIAVANDAWHRRHRHGSPSRPARPARRAARSSIRIAPTRPIRTGGWPGAASHSRSPSSCSRTSPAVRLRRSP